MMGHSKKEIENISGKYFWNCGGGGQLKWDKAEGIEQWIAL